MKRQYLPRKNPNKFGQKSHQLLILMLQKILVQCHEINLFIIFYWIKYYPDLIFCFSPIEKMKEEIFKIKRRKKVKQECPEDYDFELDDKVKMEEIETMG